MYISGIDDNELKAIINEFKTLNECVILQEYPYLKKLANELNTNCHIVINEVDSIMSAVNNNNELLRGNVENMTYAILNKYDNLNYKVYIKDICNFLLDYKNKEVIQYDFDVKNIRAMTLKEYNELMNIKSTFEILKNMINISSLTTLDLFQNDVEDKIIYLKNRYLREKEYKVLSKYFEKINPINENSLIRIKIKDLELFEKLKDCFLNKNKLLNKDDTYLKLENYMMNCNKDDNIQLNIDDVINIMDLYYQYDRFVNQNEIE